MARHPDHPAGRPRPVRTGLVALVALVGATTLGYLASVQANSGDSDGATVVLEGAALAHGNLLLSGWYLSYDGFWLLDAPFYAVATLLGGVRPAELYVVPAVIVGLVVVVGAAMAGAGRSRRAAAVGAAVITVVLCLPAHTTAYFLLRGPLHIATALFALGAFALLRRGRLGLSWAAAVILLAAGLLGDLQMVAIGLAPVAAAGLLAAARERRIAAAGPPLAAAAAAVGLALAVREAAVAIGSFHLSAQNQFATAAQRHANLHHLVQYGARVLGLSAALYGRGGAPSWLQRAHVAVAVVLAVAAVVTAARLVTGVVAGPRTGAGDPGRLRGALRAEPGAAAFDDMVLLALLAVPVLFVVLAASDDPSFARYLTAGLVFAAVLAARVCARWWDRTSWRSLRLTAAVAGVAGTAFLAAGFAFTLTATAQPKPAVGLAQWLQAHHLSRGLGDYFTASITTVDSRGRVRVRPVVTGSSGRIVSYNKGPLQRWYAGRRFQFLAFTPPVALGDVDLATAERTWGPPLAVHHVGPYDVVVWSRPITVPVVPEG